MRYLWKILRNTMAVVGVIMIMGAIGTSDFYIIELGQPEPSNVWSTVLIGALLAVPECMHLIYNEIKEYYIDVYYR